MDETLKQEIRLKLRIPEYDYELIDIVIKDAIEYLKYKISPLIDLKCGFERTLLCDRVRYVYNEASEDFEANFLNEIVSLQVKYAESRE